MSNPLDTAPRPRFERAPRWWVGLTTLATIIAVIVVMLPQSARAAGGEIGLYAGTEQFAGAGVNDSAAVELGVKFTVTVPGSVVAVRFLKPSGNTGLHSGSLWDSTGARMASLTFSGETSSGWQVARFASPVAIVPGRTYVVSYHTNTGHYAYADSAFAGGATIGSSVIRGTAGVYRYGATGYPTSTFRQSAYFVDPLFRPSSASTPTPTPTPTRTATPTPTPTPSATSPTATPSGSVPAACARDGAYVWGHLASCGWADASNTGPQATACPGGLTSNSGSTSRTIRVTAAGTTISCQRITGCLSIEAPRVTVKNVAITCTSGRSGEAANGTSVIYVDDGASAVVDHVSIDGLKGVHACIWHQGTSLTARAVNCSGVNDGVFSWADTGYSATTGDNFTVQDSYFHDFTTRTANGHIDGYQTEGAGNGLIQHNTFLMTSDSNNSTDSAVAIWNSIRSSHDITVRANLIAGGGFSVYAEDYHPSEASPAGGNTVTRIAFTDNVFSTRLFGCVGLYGIWFTRGKPTDGWNRTGNKVLETGQTVDTANPTSGGRLCT